MISDFPCFYWPWPFWWVFVRYFVDYLIKEIYLMCFSQLDLDYWFSGGRPQRLSTILIRSRQGYTLSPWSMTIAVDLYHQSPYCLSGFSTIKQLSPTPTPSSLGGIHYVHSTRKLYFTSLRVDYLHKLCHYMAWSFLPSYCGIVLHFITILHFIHPFTYWRTS